MTTLNPKPQQIVDALKAHGVRVHLVDGWDTRGREWAGPGGSRGLLGVVVHHTSTPSATGATGAPSLEWCINATSRGACNALVGREGIVHLIAAGSAFHSGNGGPWPAIGVYEAGNEGHTRLFGIEIDDPGVAQTMTAAQLEAVGRTCAALRSLCGWDLSRIITHADWTDMGPYRGRKNDPLRRYYPTSLWRDLAAKYATAAKVQTVTVTGRTPVSASVAAYRLRCSVARLVWRNPWLAVRRAKPGDVLRLPNGVAPAPVYAGPTA